MILVLVSRPSDTEAISDRLRVLTAGIKSGESLTTAQLNELLRIYLAIKQYLVTREPLRKLTVESLRARLPESFLALLQQRQQ